MGKKRDLEDPFTQSTECLTRNHERLDKLRHDLWATTVKQKRLVKLIRDEIPDSFNHDTRNLIQGITDQILILIDRTETLTAETWDHSTALYRKAYHTRKKARKAKN